jgi:hypothetical protein
MSRGISYRNLKVDKLLGVGAHLVVEAKLVLAHLLGGKDKVALPLLLALHDESVVGARHFVVDVEGAAGLDGKVKGNLFVLVLGQGVEAGLLVGIELVGQGGCRGLGGHQGPEAAREER